MRLIFMGTADFARAALNALGQSAHDICAVYTRPPAKTGRGLKVQPSPIHVCAQALGVPIVTPANLQDAATQAEFAAHQADLAIVAAYGLLLPSAVLAAPQYGCWNIHASLLPRWRGAAPIQRAIMAGDKKTGISIMQMAEGLDTGAILLRKEIAIGKADTAGTLHDKLAALGAAAMMETLAKLTTHISTHATQSKTLTAEPQAETGISYAAKISKAEARIDWTRPALALDAHIRALSPAPAAWFEANGERVKLLKAEPVEKEGKAGQILDDAPTIACGSGALRLLRVQKAGKAAMDAADFQRGTKLKKGTYVT